jgi:hypothetical protein
MISGPICGRRLPSPTEPIARPGPLRCLSRATGRHLCGVCFLCSDARRWIAGGPARSKLLLPGRDGVASLGPRRKASAMGRFQRDRRSHAQQHPDQEDDGGRHTGDRLGSVGDFLEVDARVEVLRHSAILEARPSSTFVSALAPELSCERLSQAERTGRKAGLGAPAAPTKILARDECLHGPSSTVWLCGTRMVECAKCVASAQCLYTNECSA